MQTTHLTTAGAGELRALGHAIHHTRRQHAITTSELARTSGVARRRLIAIEHGLDEPDYKLLLTIATNLNITPRALLQHAEALEANAC